MSYSFRVRAINDIGIGEEATVKATPNAGYTISGTISSYNPKNDITIELFEKVASANMLSGATPVDTWIISGSATGIGQIQQPFEMEGVAAGEYTLRVKKDGHLSYIKLTLTVDDKDIDLDDLVGVITLLPGDIDGDGQITFNDLTILLDCYDQLYPAINNPLADLDGDGQVTFNDLSLLLDGYDELSTVEP